MSVRKTTKKLKVFIGFGNESNHIAEGLKSLINNILPEDSREVVTASDIPLGANWFSTINKKITGVDVGIFCLTKKNRNNAWMHYEAGMIANITKNDKKVIPYLIDFKSADSSQSKSGDKSWDGPLTMTQGVEATEDGTWKLVVDLHTYAGKPLSDHNLKGKFDTAWKMLDQIIHSLLSAKPSDEQNDGNQRSDFFDDSVTGGEDIKKPVHKSELLNCEETELLRMIYLYALEQEFEADVYIMTSENILLLRDARKFSLAKMRKAIDSLKSKGFIEKCLIQDIPAYSLTDKGSQWNKKKA